MSPGPARRTGRGQPPHRTVETRRRDRDAAVRVGAMACATLSVGRNLGLVVALLLICVVGAVTAGDRFASTDNVLTILRLAVDRSAWSASA